MNNLATIKKLNLILLTIALIFTSCGKESKGLAHFVEGNVIIGSLDWKEVAMLRQSDVKRINANSVGKLDIAVIGSRCTAFLITDDIIMTNHHCIPTSSYAQGVKVQFKFEKDVAQSAQAEFECDEFIGNNRILDYALLRCRNNPGKSFGHVDLSTSALDVNSNIYIVQQNCDYYVQRDCAPTKKISFGQVIEVHDEYTHNADTLGGSSGSPVFGHKSNKVIGIHHAGLGNNGMGRGIENYAVPMHKIVADINERFPEVLKVQIDPIKMSYTTLKTAKSIRIAHRSSENLTVSQNKNYFKFEIKTSKYVSINIYFKNSAGDIDMTLLSPAGKVLAKSNSTQDFEIINKYLSVGSYYIKVYGHKSALGDYKLVTN
jgi:hypothetical protein